MILGLILTGVSGLLFIGGYISDEPRWMLLSIFLLVWSKTLHDLDREKEDE